MVQKEVIEHTLEKLKAKGQHLKIIKAGCNDMEQLMEYMAGAVAGYAYPNGPLEESKHETLTLSVHHIHKQVAKLQAFVITERENICAKYEKMTDLLLKGEVDIKPKKEVKKKK